MNEYGYDEFFLQFAKNYPNLFIARIISKSTNIYKAVCENGEVLAEISGKFRHEASTLSDYPTVGDFVLLDRNNNNLGNAIIHKVLKRKSAFARKAAGKTPNEQVIAANIDTIFICMSLNNDFNIRRLERYLSIAWESGAVPVIVLTKSDLCKNLEEMLSEVEAVAFGVDILVTSSESENGYLDVFNYAKEAQTIAFIGSSGVGKSTLINKLLGRDLLNTNTTDEHDKGRHTTTKSNIIKILNGALVIDTPGLREVGIEFSDLEKTFADVEELSKHCKFNDCTHTKEPACAVKKAIEDKTLSRERLLNYQKLQREATYAEKKNQIRRLKENKRKK